MSKSLDNALGGKAWSVSAIIADLNDMLDDEGRPISERRADAAVRAGVEMEMRKCPFEGSRHDKWMNVSALTQISAYYNDALAEMTGFRRQAKKADATWEDILACIVELLAGPTLYLLKQRNLNDPVPAKLAVGHKLAAGMYGVLLSVHERLALGTKIPVTVDGFLQLVDELDALVGAGFEACAGSPPMIRKAVVALMEGIDDNSVEIEPQRINIARSLALQVQLGIFWKLYDAVYTHSLLNGDITQHLVPSNMFLERKLEHAIKNIDSNAPPRPNPSMLPTSLDSETRQKLIDALNDSAEPKMLEQDIKSATELLNEPGSPIQYNGEIEPFALYIANYLNTYRLFRTELSRIELQLREQLGYPEETPIQLGGVAFPTPQLMPWLELIVGRKLGVDEHLTGNSTKTNKKG